MVTKQILTAMTTSIRQDWCSPGVLLDRVRMVDVIGLDPCSNVCSIVNAKKAISLPQDGLLVPWVGNGLVYVNSPYQGIKAWVNKSNYEASLGAEIVSLVPARVDTKWFQEGIFAKANAICFWKGRLTFVGAPAPALFPSAVIYWGKRVSLFEFAFHDKGKVFIL